MLFVILLIITIFVALMFFGTFADGDKSKKSTRWILGILTLLFALFSLNSCKANLAKKHDENVRTEKAEKAEKKQNDRKKKEEAAEKKKEEAKEKKRQKEIKENTQPFEDDATQAMEEEGVSIQFNSVDNIVLTVPDEATLVNSAARKAYASELIKKVDNQAESYNLDSPYITINTESGTKFARSTVFGGVKVYDED